MCNVERPSRYIRESFFYGRSFANDDDLNEQASRWLEGTANVRRHATGNRVAAARLLAVAAPTRLPTAAPSPTPPTPRPGGTIPRSNCAIFDCR